VVKTTMIPSRSSRQRILDTKREMMMHMLIM
jgi:hypothetical protein